MARVERTFGGTTHMNFPTRCASLLSSSSTVATLVDVMVATVGKGRWGRGLRCGGVIKREKRQSTVSPSSWQLPSAC